MKLHAYNNSRESVIFVFTRYSHSDLFSFPHKVQREMATWRFSTTLSGTEAVSSYNAVARFIDFSRGRNGGVGGVGGGSGNKAKQLMLMRKWQVRPMRRSFSVRNVSSEPQQKVKDPVTEKEGSISFVVSLYKWRCSVFTFYVFFFIENLWILF